MVSPRTYPINTTGFHQRILWWQSLLWSRRWGPHDGSVKAWWPNLRCRNHSYREKNDWLYSTSTIPQWHMDFPVGYHKRKFNHGCFCWCLYPQFTSTQCCWMQLRYPGLAPRVATVLRGARSFETAVSSLTISGWWTDSRKEYCVYIHIYMYII